MKLEPGESRRLPPREVYYRPPGMVYRTFASQEKGDREQQQDSVASSSPEYERERGILCVLSDGMGGLAAGEEVSGMVVDTMISCFFESSPEESPARILLRGCAEAQKKVIAAQAAPRDRGATLVAILVREGMCSFLSVGDSRIYLYRHGGLILLTRDQNKRRRIETQIGLGTLPPEARTDRTLRSLSMFIGREELEYVDRSPQPFPLIPGDRLLLMSDGVFEVLTPQEMEETAGLMGNLVTGTLIDQVLEKKRPGQDNCTVMMLECVEVDGRMSP